MSHELWEEMVEEKTWNCRISELEGHLGTISPSLPWPCVSVHRASQEALILGSLLRPFTQCFMHPTESSYQSL